MGKVLQMTRYMLPLVITALLVGCDKLVPDDTPLGQFMSAAGSQEPVPRFKRLVAANAPALQIGLIEREIGTTLLLESHRDGVDTWLSADGAALLTQDGMIRGTRGLGQGLLAADVSQSLALVTTEREGQLDRTHTYLTGENRTAIRSYRCTVELQGTREVALGSRRAKTTLLKEDCTRRDQSFFNLYWVEDGEIIQSRQWVGKEVGPVSTRIVE